MQINIAEKILLNAQALLQPKVKAVRMAYFS